MLYNALVLPYLDYCSCVWSACGASSQMRLERIQNKGTLTGEHTLRNAEQVLPRPSSFIFGMKPEGLGTRQYAELVKSYIDTIIYS